VDHGAEALEVADRVKAVPDNSRTIPTVVHVVRAAKMRARIDDRGKKVIVRIAPVVKASGRDDRGEMVSVRHGRVETENVLAARRVRAIVRFAPVVKVIVRFAPVVKVIVRFAPVVKASGRDDRGEMVSGHQDRVGKELGKSVAVAKVIAAQVGEALVNVLVSGRRDHGENLIARLDRVEMVIVRNAHSPTRSVALTRFVAPRVAASTSAAKFPMSAQVKSDGSMRVQSVHESPRSEVSRSQFASALVKQWRRSIRVRLVRSPLHSGSVTDFVRLAA